MRHLTAITIAVLALAGCNRSFDLFSLEVDTAGGLESVPLRERSGVPVDEEGVLVAGGDPLVLAPVEPVVIEGERTALTVLLSRIVDDVSVRVFDDDGAIIARERSSLAVGSTEAPRAFALSLGVPQGATVAAIEIERSTGDAVAVVVEGLALGRASDGVRVRNDGTLAVAPGVFVAEWEEPGPERRWTVSRSRSARWQGHHPVEVGYRMPQPDPLEARALAADPSPQTEVVPRLATVTIGASTFELELRPGANRVVIYPEVEGVSLDQLMITSVDPDLVIEGVTPLVESPAMSEPIPVDFGTLMRYPVGLWRNPDYELFSWTLYPEVLIVDTADYAVQSRFFKRLAFFVEKVGYRGTMMSDEQLDGRHGYNAHNYNAGGLASFFSTAEAEGTMLNEEELLLRELAVANGIIRRVGSGYEPITGGVLAVSQESLGFPTLRELLVSHEAYHGVYYAERDYVRAIDVFWDALTSDQKRFWRLLLRGLQYDVDDGYLLRNEYHAYLLQQPVASAGWYFESRSADRIARWFPGERSWLEAYLAEYSGTHRRQAVRAEQALFALTGLRARDVFCLEPHER